MPGLQLHIAPDVDRTVADHLIAIAIDHLGGEALVARVSVTEVQGQAKASVTALVIGPAFAAISEARMRGGHWQPTMTQVFHRTHVLEVASTDTEAWAVLAVPEMPIPASGVQIEGPLVSIPAGTRAHELLL